MTETTQPAGDVEMIEVTNELFDTWATDPAGSVALHLRQKLVPVEGEAGVIFPPTYADIGYNIDTLSDGTKVATIDSVGSQANRMEPIFKTAPDGQSPNPLPLVPPIEIVIHVNNGDDRHKERRSILDLAHRSADAVVQSSPTLVPMVRKALETLRQTGNAAPLCALAPTSLVFGMWDSRGGTGEKRPRLVRAIIRAWDVEVLHAAAQFNSIWKALTAEQRAELEREAKKQKVKLSEKGLTDAPATFRKLRGGGQQIPEFREGAPNPERRVLGGVLAKGGIQRDVTVNLVALRGIRGADAEDTKLVQKYLLGLSLLAATAEIGLFLREGCHLRYEDQDLWVEVPRRGQPKPVDLGSSKARKLIEKYTSTAAEHFRPNWPRELEHNFDLEEARKLLAKKGDENLEEE